MRAAVLRRSRDTAGRGHLRRRRPGDHGRVGGGACHHRDRRGQGAGRRVPGDLPHARQPRLGHPSGDHRPHRDHRRPWWPRLPRVRAVLPALAEFLGGTVIVGHNIRFDVSFLNAALHREGWPRLANPVVDTVALARRLVRDEVPNCRLGTLADRFRLDHRPCHRALDDALATTDLLHLLLERAASWGVLGLDDLLVLPRLGGHPQVAKLRLTNDAAPLARCLLVRRRAGGAAVRGEGHQPAPAGALVLLRRRPPQGRQPAAGDGGRALPGGPLHPGGGRRRGPADPPPPTSLQPPGNPSGRGRLRRPHAGRAVSEAEDGPCRPADGSLYLGPLPSSQQAAAVVEAIQTVAPLRRCTERLGARRPLPLRADPMPAGAARRGPVPLRR